MKEATIQIFEKGDFVRGKADNGYALTNADMARGLVTSVDESRGSMTVKVLQHPTRHIIGKEYRVHNTSADFELLPKKANTASESVKLSIEVSVPKGSKQVTATALYNGDYFGAHAECSPADVFNMRIGATLAVARVLERIEASEGKLDAKVGDSKTPKRRVEIGDLVRISSLFTSGGLESGDLAEVVGLGEYSVCEGKRFLYVTAREHTDFTGDECVDPGRCSLKQPFTYLAPSEYEILPSQPVRPGKKRA